MDLTRREALAAGAVFLVSPAHAGALGKRLRRTTQARPPASLFVSILLRGGADGLHLAPPLGDPDYQKARKTLDPGGGVPLAAGFALHPALRVLEPLVEEKRLALVPALGLPAATRSHFQAQDRLEWGVAGTRGGNTGWLARALEAGSPKTPGGLDALAIAPALPLALRGSSSLALGAPARLGLAGVSRAALRAIREAYATHSDPASRAGLEALELWEALEPALHRTGAPRRPGTGRRGRPRHGLGAAVDQAIALDERGFSVSVLWLESDGWDTHHGQRPVAERLLSDLGTALAGLWEYFGTKRELRVVVSTEFGRTLRPNGSGGTDHGTGSAALVLGTRVRGGVVGAWPGLSESALFEGRDLRPTVDLREVYAEALEDHRGAKLDPAVFPRLERQGLELFESQAL